MAHMIIPTTILKDTVEAKPHTKASIISLKDVMISPKAKDNAIKDSSIIMKSSSKLESITSIPHLAPIHSSYAPGSRYL